MTTEDAMAYLQYYSQMGSFYELETMNDLLDALGRPDRSLDIIHVAGTNGKGSTTAYLSSILSVAGYAVGTYTSPSIYHYLERFTYCNKSIEETVFAALTTRVAEAADLLAKTGRRHATVFEMELAIAYLGANHYHCTFFIQETGLGGRLDATNVVEKPALTVLTAIGLDHTAELGNTITAVATEKAGILKSGVPLVAYCNDQITNAVLANRAATLDVPMQILDCNDITLYPPVKGGQCFHFRHRDYRISLLGAHQAKNAALAILSTETLRTLGYAITDTQIQKGLSRTHWPGRFDVIHRNPDVVLDGAHNPPAAQALAEGIRTYYSDKHSIGIVHIFRDKDALEILKPLASVLTRLVVTSTHSDRSHSAERLAEIAAQVFPSEQIQCVTDFSHAIHTTLAQCTTSDAVFVFGSLSHLSDAKNAVHAYYNSKENGHDE